MKVVRHVLARLGLSLNEAKTHIVDATTASFDFLGFTIQMRRGASSGKPYPNVRPSEASLKTIKAKLTALTRRELTVVALSDIVGNVNRSLRGWVNYFYYRHSSRAMNKVRNHAEARLRTHLMKRHKVKARRIGLGRFPHADLYGLRAVQGFCGTGLALGACLGLKNIGKPCAGKLHARFDEGGQEKPPMARLLRHRQTKGAATDRLGLRDAESCSLLYPRTLLHFVSNEIRSRIRSDTYPFPVHG